MQAVLVAIELLVAAALIVVVLLQRSEGGGLAMGSGGSGLGNLFSPRGAGDLLTRTTAILAALFFLTCLGLNILSLHGRNEKSFLEAPASPAAPNNPLQKSVLPVKPVPAPAPTVPTPH